MRKISLIDMKEALRDQRFRDSLPVELKPDISKWLNNPGCACNVPFYRKLLRDYGSYVSAYFPGAEIIDDAKETANFAQNHFLVINCHINELEGRLQKLPPGRKQVEVARWQDQVTAVINELDFF